MNGVGKCGEYVNNPEARGSRDLPSLQLRQPEAVLMEAVQTMEEEGIMQQQQDVFY